MRRKKEKRFRVKYAVLGEGITEQWYLRHLKEFKGYVYVIRPSLFADITIEKAEGIIDELVTGGCNQITYLTDYDTVVAQGKRDIFNKIVRKYNDVEEVLICDSMPSIELWFLLHFKYSTKEYTNCAELVRDLKVYLPEYQKRRTYLEKGEWFNQLVQNGGDEQAQENAIKLLKMLDAGNIGEHFPFSKMPLAIDEFEKQTTK